MASRRSTRSSSDEGAGAFALFILIGAFSIYRWIEMLPTPWKIAIGILCLSIALLFAWTIASLTHQFYVRRLMHRDLMQLSPAQFEERVKLLLADLGWTRLEIRGGSGDRGVDIVGHYEGQRYIVQCKRYRKQVPPAMVRDLVGALHIQQADRALMVTTSGYTKQGYAEAYNQAIDLWDGAILAKQMECARILRTNPECRSPIRRRTGVFIYAVLLINSVVITYAFMIAGPPPLSVPAIVAPPSQSVLLTDPTPMLTTAPSTTPMITPTIGPTVPLPTTILPTASVFHGGNIRTAPSMDGGVIDQINASETVMLSGRSADGLWLQITNMRGVSGWTHRTLLQIDPDSERQLPIVDL